MELKEQYEDILLLGKELSLYILETLLKEENQQSENISEKEITPIVNLFENNFKIIKHRSNFYEYISKVGKITKIKTSTMFNYTIVDEFETIEKKDFYKFIVSKDDLPLETIENAEIEIISPILKQGNFKWKGIYNNEQIDFSMKDKEFKKSIF